MAKGWHREGDMAVVDDPELIQVLYEPVRWRVLRRLDEPRSITEVAKLLQLPRSRLYHHFAVLEEWGLIAVAGERRHRNTIERLYKDDFGGTTGAGEVRGMRMAPGLAALSVPGVDTSLPLLERAQELAMAVGGTYPDHVPGDLLLGPDLELTNAQADQLYRDLYWVLRPHVGDMAGRAEQFADWVRDRKTPIPGGGRKHRYGVLIFLTSLPDDENVA